MRTEKQTRTQKIPFFPSLSLLGLPTSPASDIREDLGRENDRGQLETRRQKRKLFLFFGWVHPLPSPRPPFGSWASQTRNQFRIQSEAFISQFENFFPQQSHRIVFFPGIIPKSDTWRAKYEEDKKKLFLQKTPITPNAQRIESKKSWMGASDVLLSLPASLDRKWQFGRERTRSRKDRSARFRNPIPEDRRLEKVGRQNTNRTSMRTYD